MNCSHLHKYDAGRVSYNEMKKRTIGIGLIIAGISLTTTSVFAVNQRDVGKRIVEVEAEIKACDYEKYKDMIAVLEADIIALDESLFTAEQNKKEAETEGDSLGVMRAEVMISNYTKQLDEKRKTLVSYQLQMDMDAYYVTYQDKLIADKESRIHYECYECRLNIVRYSAQRKYLTTMKAELEKKLKIEQEKLKLGYTTELEVNVVQNQLDETVLSIDEADLEIEFQKNMLLLYGEEDTEINLPNTLGTLEGDFKSQFCANSAQIKYYEHLTEAYNNYIDNADDSDEDLEKVRFQSELSQLNKQQYRTELERYVEQREKNYKQAKLKVEEYDCEINIMEQRIENSTLLYQQGRLREIDVMELETEKARLEYERQCCFCDAQLNCYILENNIED